RLIVPIDRGGGSLTARARWVFGARIQCDRLCIIAAENACGGTALVKHKRDSGRGGRSVATYHSAANVEAFLQVISSRFEDGDVATSDDDLCSTTSVIDAGVVIVDRVIFLRSHK